MGLGVGEEEDQLANLSRVGMPSNTRVEARAPVCQKHGPAEAVEGYFPTKNSRGAGQGVLSCGSLKDSPCQPQGPMVGTEAWGKGVSGLQS